MPSNAFDDLPPGLVTPTPEVPAPAGKANAFDDITPPVQAQKEKPPVSARDRVQATEGGILRGGAYLAGALPDAVANLYGLGKAAVGTGYHLITGNPIPESLNTGDPNPVSRWITRQMDKSPITTTQPTRPDDTASRYLQTAGTVGLGAAAGGEGLVSTAKNFATALPPAFAGQAVAEAKPFGDQEWANNAASIGAQGLTMLAMPRGRGEPVASEKNATVEAAQKEGYTFPPATTNPTPGNRVIETIAGKTNLQQRASLNNQDVTNQIGREVAGLPKAEGPITELELEQAKAQAAPGYEALRNAGQISVPENFESRLNAALSKQSGAGKLDPSLRNSGLETTVANLAKNPSFDAGDAMDTIAILREKANQAYRSGDASSGAAYKGISKVIEDAIENHLGDSDLMRNFTDSRKQFARIATIEENRDPTTGNLDAGKLAAAYKRGDYMDGKLLLAAKAAGNAPRAFAQPTHSAGVNHLGLCGSLAAGSLAAREYMPEHLGLGAAIGAAAVPAARIGARAYALGPGQAGALSRMPKPLDPNVALANYLASQASAGRTP